ncbi:hypothetical protein scyTo_0015520 [Scyliorhinus torazame]|uniref:UDP-glucuronosyltransferase n=1 Tax=Scyliorhinus torazame TaxID=75743 RepID=A0A401PU22_SCYTO|nr:hypothetical protein [Scyliorhinus torazame]
MNEFEISAARNTRAGTTLHLFFISSGCHFNPNMEDRAWKSRLQIAYTLGIIATLSCPITQGANILVVPVDGSHWVNMRILIEELKLHGHTASVLYASSSWLETRGAAKVINVAAMQSNDLLQALNEVINDTSYRDNMQKLSALHRDQPESPMERAIFWIEYVARHKGAAHLRSESYRLPWYVYYCVDVMILLLSVLLMVTVLTVLLLKKLCNIARKKKQKIQ